MAYDLIQVKMPHKQSEPHTQLQPDVVATQLQPDVVPDTLWEMDVVADVTGEQEHEGSSASNGDQREEADATANEEPYHLEKMSNGHEDIPIPGRRGTENSADSILPSGWQENATINHMLAMTGLEDMKEWDSVKRLIALSHREQVSLDKFNDGQHIELVTPHYDALVMYHKDDEDYVTDMRDKFVKNITLVDHEPPKILLLYEDLGNMGRFTSKVDFMERAIKHCSLIFQFFSKPFADSQREAGSASDGSHIQVQAIVKDELIFNSIMSQINPHNLIPVTPPKDYENGIGKRPFGLRAVEGIMCDRVLNGSDKTKAIEMKKLTRLFNERLRFRQEREEKQLMDLQIAMHQWKRRTAQEQDTHTEHLRRIGSEPMDQATARQFSTVYDGAPPAQPLKAGNNSRNAATNGEPNEIQRDGLERSEERMDDQTPAGQTQIQHVTLPSQSGSMNVREFTEEYVRQHDVKTSEIHLHVQHVEQMNLQTGNGEAHYSTVNTQK